AGVAPAPQPVDARGDTMAVAGSSVTVHISGADAVSAVNPDDAQLRWDMVVAARSEATVEWSVSVTDAASVVIAAQGLTTWSVPVVSAGDWRLGPWLDRSIGDLAALRVALAAAPDD